MSDNPYIRLHGSDNRAAARGWDEGYKAGAAAKQAEIVKLLRERAEDSAFGERSVLLVAADLIERGGES